MQVLYYFIICFLFILGFNLIAKNKKETHQLQGVKFKNKRFRKTYSQILNHYNQEQDFLKTAGFPVNLYQYQLVRISSICVFFLVHGLNQNWLEASTVEITIFIVVFIITSPRLSIRNKKTPFAVMLAVLNKYNQRKKDKELYKALLQLKNLVIVQKDSPMSGEFLVEHLTKFTKVTKHTFSKTLAIMREGSNADAADYFKAGIGTKLGIEFANILTKLDELNPSELEEQLILIQSSVSDERVTEKMKQQDMISNLIFIPIVATAIVILLNFVIITVWLDSFHRMLDL